MLLLRSTMVCWLTLKISWRGRSKSVIRAKTIENVGISTKLAMGLRFPVSPAWYLIIAIERKVTK